MSQCIDWHFEDTECPNCSNTFKVLWVEVLSAFPGDQLQIRTVGKETCCPRCKAEFNIDKVKTTKGGEFTCSQKR